MLLYCVCFISKSTAQDSLTFKLAYIAVTQDRPALRIGDTVPDVQLQKMVNYSAKKTSLREFKGKLLILHFWHQYCSNCIKEFARLQELQKTFADSIIIMPVTFQSERSVNDFFALRNASGRQITLPSIAEDTLLRKMFPHNGDPHEVWINKNGVVTAITEANALNDENINALLNAGKVMLPEKKYDFTFNPRQPFLVNHNGGSDSSFLYRSLISPNIDSINSAGFQQQADSVRTRLFMANVPIVELYKEAYTNYDTINLQDLSLDFLNKRIVVIAHDSDKFRDYNYFLNADYKAQQAFKANNLFTYELILPPSFSSARAYKIMIQDLDRYFNVQSSVEKITTKAMELVRTSKNDKIQTHALNPEAFLGENKAAVGITNKPIGSLVTMLNMYYNIPLIVDKTGYVNNADITLGFSNGFSLSSLNQELSKYDLSLKEKTITINALVLKEQNP